MPAGTFHSERSGTLTSSAWEPAPIVATTVSPGATLVTLSPTACTTPAAW
jgi:hypothetical protein